MGEEEEEKKKSVERHFQTVIQAIIIILVGWFGNRTMETSDIVIRMEERQGALIQTMIEMKKENVSPMDFKNQRDLFDIRINALTSEMEKSRKEGQTRIMNQWQVIRELENKVESYHAKGRYSPDQMDGVYNYEDDNLN